jgi:conjugative transposon TraM protein
MEKKKLKTYLVYTAATIVFIVIVYMLFSSESSEDANLSSHLNSNLPEGEFETLPNDKITAYEDLAQADKAQMQMRGLGADELSIDLSSLSDSLAAQNPSEPGKDVGKAASDDVSAAIDDTRQAIQALQEERKSTRKTSSEPSVQRQKSQDDLDSERRMRELEEARRRNAEVQKEVLQMLRSQQQGNAAAESKADDNALAATVAAEGVAPISDNQGDVATTLGGKSRRSGGFYGMSNVPVQRNSIKACAYGEQVVGDGQSLRVRLLEPMMVSGQLISAGSILAGTCRITTDRLLVSILSIEHGGVITRVALEVYDNDGQQGLYVPGSLELEAGREIGSDIASSVGSTAASQTSMFNQQSASEQIKAEVGRGVVQGTFKFIGKKLQVIKILVRDKHMIFLVSQK